MKGLIGKKVGMTQIFDRDGNRVPVTVIEVGGNVVVQKKSAHGKDGYSAVKIGFGEVHKHEKDGEEPRWRLSKPRVGVFTQAGIDEPRKHLREFRVSEEALDDYEVGAELGADHFRAGEFVDVTGTSKGHGYTGVMKRHNFAGAKSSHGVHEYFRHGGAIGASAYPARVIKGKKMPGQHGATRATIQNLTVVDVLPEDQAILVKGAVPGPNGGIVTIQSAVKKIQARG
jgi:large subunit ribosomal protein L3